MKLLVLLLVGYVAVEAMIRTDYYGGRRRRKYYDKASSESTESTERTTREPKEYRCPAGWTMYSRTPSAFNEYTSQWCMQVIPTFVPVSIQDAAGICAREGAELTNYENNAERLDITAKAWSHIGTTLAKRAGSIAVGGRRVEECRNADVKLLLYPPCNNKQTLFYFPEKHTDPAYSWTTFAASEPNSVVYQNVVEDCLQLHIAPGRPGKNGLLNDFLCTQPVSPYVPNNDLYKNVGALCGKKPDFN